MIGGQIAAILDQMAGLDAVQAEVSLGEFGRTFQHWLERTAMVASPQRMRGVAVLNATAARGVNFRALFILGMNEGVFPRTIREDAFLRDRDREVLERDLGYKISQKFAAFDEEKLLFTLLVNAARERLYCSFQRADESGRVLAPSWYLAELKRALGAGHAEPITERTIPRSIADKVRCAPFSDENLLLPEELAVRLSVAGGEAVSLVEAAHLSPVLYKSGIKTVERLDLSTQRLDEYDGMVSGIEDYRRHFSRRGLSPTGLELYGRCPFQYFAHQLIGLERLETPEESAGPSVAEYGDLGHAILRTAYQGLIDGGYFGPHAPPVNTDQILTAAAQRAFAEYESEHPVGYPLAWQTLRENLTETIRAAIDRDLQELRESGFIPVALEAGTTDELPADWPESLRGLPIRGRMDRIDIDRTGHRLRIVDYKFKLGASPGSADRDLRRAALRGERLQPPIYSLLGERWAKRNGRDAGALSVETSFFYIAPRWKDGPLLIKRFLSEDLSGKLGDEIKKTVLHLVNGIQSGHFFMQPGQHCQFCDVAEVCRKNHPPSLWRAENDPITEAHRRLHDNDPKDL
jgi:ATP-dependent helicase/nuclease subunit B